MFTATSILLNSSWKELSEECRCWVGSNLWLMGFDQQSKSFPLQPIKLKSVWDGVLTVWSCVTIWSGREGFCYKFTREFAKFCLMAEVCRYSSGWFKAKPTKMRVFCWRHIQLKHHRRPHYFKPVKQIYLKEEPSGIDALNNQQNSTWILFR